MFQSSQSQEMVKRAPTTLPLWDPANLLQISYNIGQAHTPIFCVGASRSKRDSPRCRYTISESDSSLARSLVADLSIQEPGAVSETDLLQLASHCLCDEYHKSQDIEVSRRWLGVVLLASEHRSRPIRPTTNGTEMWESSPGLFLELKTAQQELEEASRRCNMLEKESASSKHVIKELMFEKEVQAATVATLSGLASKAEEKLSLLREKSNSWRILLLEAKMKEAELDGKASSIEEEKNTLTMTVAELSGYKSKAKEKISLLEEKTDFLQKRLLEVEIKEDGLNKQVSSMEKEKNALNKELGGLRQELKAATESGQVLKTELSHANREMGIVKNETMDLRKNNSVILDAIKQVEAERDTARRDFWETTSEIAEQKHTNAALQSRLKNLQLTEEVLRQSISACWLHRFWAWLEHLRGFIASKRSRASK